MRRLLLLALLACGGDSNGPTPVGQASYHVLFVGNSLTYFNDLPLMVHALGESTGVTIDAQAVAKPNFGLEQHWADGDALAAIARGGWDVVVLQQGPSALPASRVNLLQWADSFAVRIRAAGGTPALYQVWPASVDLAANFDRSLESYALAAQQVGGTLLPAGRTWQLAWQRDGSLELYGSDGFHPSPLGSYVAALAIFGGLTGRSPVGLPSGLSVPAGTVHLPSAMAQLVQQAAADALASANLRRAGR